MDSFKDSFYFKKSGSSKQISLNIVPVLDMMTLIIFFLASTAVFLEMTKQTVPPSATKTITAPERPPPLAPRLTVFNEDKQYRIIMRWSGETSGQIEKLVPKVAPEVAGAAPVSPEVKEKNIETDREANLKAGLEIMNEFFVKFPTERTFQVAMSANTGYQHMISMMDAIQLGVHNYEQQSKAVTPQPANIVLVSYAEVDAEFEKNYKEDGTTPPAKK